MWQYEGQDNPIFLSSENYFSPQPALKPSQNCSFSLYSFMNFVLNMVYRAFPRVKFWWSSMANWGHCFSWFTFERKSSLVSLV